MHGCSAPTGVNPSFTHFREPSMRNTLRTAVLATAVIGALAMSTASASTGSPKTATFLVSITVENSCTVTAQPIAFGTVNTMAPIHDAQGNVVVNCTGV